MRICPLECQYTDGAVLSPSGDTASQLAMLLFRYPGQHTAKHVLAGAGDTRAEDKVKHRIEFVAEVDVAETFTWTVHQLA